MELKQILEQLAVASARMEAVVCIAGMLGDAGEIAEPLKAMLEELDAADFRSCFPDAPSSLLDALNDSDTFNEEFAGWVLATGKLGFAVKFATPVMTHYYNFGRSYCWSLYTTNWVYGDTLGDAVNTGLAWVAQQREREAKP